MDATAEEMLTLSMGRSKVGVPRSLSEAAGEMQTMRSENNGDGKRTAAVLHGSA
jgi:hypothetical protein